MPSTHLDHILVSQWVTQPHSLWVVLAAHPPHQRILELKQQAVVDLAAERVHGGPASVLSQHHRLVKVWFMAHLLGVDSNLRRQVEGKV